MFQTKSKGTILLIVCVIGMAVIVGCQKDSGFTEESDGTLMALDTSSGPFDKGGVKITIDKEEDFVNFQITDEEGNETVEYYRFFPKEKKVKRLYYVSIMGTQFKYIMDYEALSLTKVLDADDKDITESVKKMGRFDSAEEQTKEAVEKIRSYFKEQYGKTIDQIVQ